MTNITAIAPWFGSKRTLAPQIVEELGPHASYFEPFCGSCAVLFAKPHTQQETVSDLHGGLIALARVLADEQAALALYERASRTLCCTALYEDSRAWLDGCGPDFTARNMGDVAYHYLVVSWLGRNGTSGCSRTNWQPSVRYTPGGGSTATRWRAVAESIPTWHQRLRTVNILQRDGFELVEKVADDPRVAIYADPPYLMATRGNGGGSRYLHDFSEGDHVRLAGLLGRFRHARVVVSYYDHPSLAEMYPGWTVVRLSAHKNLHVQNRRGEGRCEAPEVLLINGSSAARDLFSDLGPGKWKATP